MTVIMRIQHGARGDTRARADFKSPQVIRDGVDDLWNPVDGTRITSKRAYEKQLARNGLAVDDRPRIRDRNTPAYDDLGLRQDIARSLRESPQQTDDPFIPELDDPHG